MPVLIFDGPAVYADNNGEENVRASCELADDGSTQMVIDFGDGFVATVDIPRTSVSLDLRILTGIDSPVRPVPAREFRRSRRAKRSGES